MKTTNEIVLKHTKLLPLFLKAKEDGYRTICAIGGSRSSKSYSILQFMIIEALLESNRDKNLVFSIARKSGTSLRLSTMVDFFKIIKGLGLFDPSKHKKSPPEQYELNGNTFVFLSLDSPEKKQGVSHYMCFVDEVLEIDFNTWSQLSMRTTNMMLAAGNPSKAYHFIYNKVINKPDTYYNRSTYKDNPFVPQTIIDELESLKETDETLYNIYCLGEKANLLGQVFTNWKVSNEFKEGEVVWGLDFGFVNKTALVKVSQYDGQIYLQQYLYQSHLTNQDLINKLKSLNIKEKIWADSAEPARIFEIKQAGFNVVGATKKVNDRIDFVKRFNLNVYKSPDLESELENYSWREKKSGEMEDEIVKINDHLVDAFGMAMHNQWGLKNNSFSASQMPKINLREERSVFESFENM